MKKSLIALAVLAASGASFAQSSVTLYGVADVWVGSTSTTTAGVKLSQTVQNGGGYNGNRWGLRGVEDLGGGLKAKFQFESGFTIDDGNVANGATMFGRQAFAGLEGDFGSLTAGRQYTSYDTLRGATNHAFDTSFTVTGSVWGQGVADYAGRTNNTLRYDSPAVAGVSGSLSYGLGENKTATVNASTQTSLHVKYAMGPVLVGVGYQAEKVAAVTTKYTLLAGTYDLGVVKLQAGFNKADNATLQDSEVQLGVSAPIGANAAVGIGYATADSETAAGADAGKKSGFALTGYYDLSKRTRAYAATNSTTTKNAAGATTAKSAVTLAVGVRHSF
jgi:predicted porin